jgi:hypothetical protein
MKGTGFRGCVRVALSAFSPVGTAEKSPGRESWVEFEKRPSPAGTTENDPGRQSWVVWTTGECYGNHPRRTRWSIAEVGGTQDCILGHFQPSLRDWVVLEPIPRTTPDFLYAALGTSAYAAFFTESRTRLCGSNKLHRKSGPSWAILSRPFGTECGEGSSHTSL